MLRKEVVALRSQRSRSPRGQRAQKQPLALKDKPVQKGKGGGKGRGKGNNNSKGGKSSGHDTTGAHLFDDFQQKHKNALWHEKANGNPGNCWRFQRNNDCLCRLCSSHNGCSEPLSHLRSESCLSRHLEVTDMSFYRVGQTCSHHSFLTCRCGTTPNFGPARQVTSSLFVFCRPT